MTEFVFPEVLDLASAPAVAEALVRHVRTTPDPVATTRGLRQAGVPLVQMMIAARKLAAADGKSFSVRVEPDCLLLQRLAALGIDPMECGATIAPPAKGSFMDGPRPSVGTFDPFPARS